MERRTLLAFVLAITVLFLYQSIFVKPKPPEKKPEVIVNTEVVKESQPSAVSSPKSSDKTTNVDFEAKEWVLKSTHVEFVGTNVGGSLHKIKIGGRPMPITNVLQVAGAAEQEFTPVVNEEHRLVLVSRKPTGTVEKTIERKNDYVWIVRIKMSSLENVSFNLFTVDGTEMSNVKRDPMLDEYSYYANNKVVRKGNASRFSPKENRILTGDMVWAGFREHFTALLIKPEFPIEQYAITSVNDKTLNFSVVPKVADLKGEATFEFTLFLGPQDTSLMKKEGKTFEKIVAFSNWAILDWIAMAIFYTVPFLHNITHSWGLSIILVSLLIYGLTYPLTMKSMLSMRRMQLMQPKIKALQERYKGDPQKMNAEVMEVYRREKINPVGGCLPFLLQMPVFIALYQVLWRSHYFQGEGFLWVKDLTLPDRLIILPFSLPFLGNEFNILPILMGIVMFAQQKVSAKNMVITDEQQAMQQKMMMYFFPVFIAFIFYHFASGLSLYFTVFYLLSTFTQWKMSKVK